MTRIPIRASTGPYDVLLGEGALAELPGSLRALGTSPRVALVTDQNVQRLWGPKMEEILRRAGFEPRTFVLPPGELSKSLAQADLLYGQLAEAGLDRKDTLVAFGGGVVGDLGGFVAATYHRGMSLVHVPTSVLAQVDSSIGGKVALDHRLAKNLIGAFYPPRLVVADSALLGSLPARERWNGLAELVKAALIGDPELFSQTERSLEAFAAGQLPAAQQTEWLERAVRVKAAIVSEDEREAARRMVLNLGHTFGHALEAATGFDQLSHGEAVVLGMRASARLSVRLGLLGASVGERVLSLLRRFPHPAAVKSALSVDTLMQLVRRDKKSERERARFIVLADVGQAKVQEDVPMPMVEAIVGQMVSEL